MSDRSLAPRWGRKLVACPLAGAALVLVAAAAVYAPILDDHFSSDDYQNLGLARQTPLSLAGLLQRSDVHLFPVARLLWEAEYALFRLDASGYHSVSLALHLANTLLLWLLVRRLTRDDRWALAAGIVFGLGASHWRTTMWITTQAQLLAAFWLLAALLLWLAYLETGRRSLLVVAALAHLLMIFSFTTGIELPVLLLLAVALLGKSAPGAAPRSRGVALSILPFVAMSAFYLAARAAAMPADTGLLARFGGWLGLVRAIPEAVRFMAGGLTFGYLRSLAGAYFRWHGPLPWLWWVQIGILGLATLAAVVMARSDLARNRRLLACCALWTVLLYLPAALGRLASGATFEFFVTRGRYLYLPALPMALFVAVVGVETYRALGRSGRRVVQRLGLFAALFVAVMNVYDLRRREAMVDASTHAFAIVEARFATDLERVLATTRGPVAVVERQVGGGEAAHYAGWNVTSRHLAMVHLEPRDLRRLAFVAADGARPAVVYEVIEGRLVPD
ncbi:MAG: hypothetical protein ACRD0X_04370 [Thermoanaerobaculia bacterium]